MTNTQLLHGITAWEAGELSPDEEVDLFAGLARSGLAWRLQGTYGRTARRLIDAGFISIDGEPTRWPESDSEVEA